MSASKILKINPPYPTWKTALEILYRMEAKADLLIDFLNKH